MSNQCRNKGHQQETCNPTNLLWVLKGFPTYRLDVIDSICIEEAHKNCLQKHTAIKYFDVEIFKILLRHSQNKNICLFMVDEYWNRTLKDSICHRHAQSHYSYIAQRLSRYSINLELTVIISLILIMILSWKLTIFNKNFLLCY